MRYFGKRRHGIATENAWLEIVKVAAVTAGAFFVAYK